MKFNLHFARLRESSKPPSATASFANKPEKLNLSVHAKVATTAARCIKSNQNLGLRVLLSLALQIGHKLRDLAQCCPFFLHATGQTVLLPAG